MKATSSRLSLAEHARKIFHYKCAVGTQPEDLVNHSHWAGVFTHAGASPGDRVEIVDENGTWYCEALIAAVDDRGASLVIIKGTMVENPQPRGLAPRPNDGFTVRSLGSHHGFAAVRPDGSVLRDGFSTENAAAAWLGSYRATLRRDAQREAV